MCWKRERFMEGKINKNTNEEISRKFSTPPAAYFPVVGKICDNGDTRYGSRSFKLVPFIMSYKHWEVFQFYYMSFDCRLRTFDDLLNWLNYGIDVHLHRSFFIIAPTLSVRNPPWFVGGGARVLVSKIWITIISNTWVNLKHFFLHSYV